MAMLSIRHKPYAICPGIQRHQRTTRRGRTGQAPDFGTPPSAKGTGRQEATRLHDRTTTPGQNARPFFTSEGCRNYITVISGVGRNLGDNNIIDLVVIIKDNWLGRVNWRTYPGLPYGQTEVATRTGGP